MREDPGEKRRGPSDFGQDLRRRRQEAKLTVAELARRALLITEAGIRALESGKSRSARADTANALADALTLQGDDKRDFVALADTMRRRDFVEEPAPPDWDTGSTATPPSFVAALIDREREREEVDARLDRGTRLVALVGPGGVGKSRVATAVAAAFAARHAADVRAVELAPLRATDDPRPAGERVAAAVARVLGGGTSPRPGRQLLLLENFEPVLDAGPLLPQLLADDPGLTLLVTSTRSLRLPGEHEYPIGPLDAPSAAALFRARAGSGTFAADDATIAVICDRLGRLPLAVELVAARCGPLTPRDLLVRLERPLALLVGGSWVAPPRHWTLRDTIAWSHDLLEPAERAVFRRLAAFAGGGDLDAAEAVCGPAGDPLAGVANALAALVDASLARLDRTAGVPPRYAMTATIHEYGDERLAASGEEEPIRGRHADHYLALAARAAASPADAAARAALAREHDNLHAALGWATATGDADRALRLAAALASYWTGRGLIHEGRRRLRWALALEGGAPTARAAALAGAVALALAQGDASGARPLAEEGLALARAADDAPLVAALLGQLGIASRQRADYPAAASYLAESLDRSRALPDRHVETAALANLALIAANRGDFAGALALLEPARDRADLSITIGEILLLRGELAAARGHLEDAAAFSSAMDDEPGAARVVAALGRVALAAGDDNRAAALLEEALSRQENLGDWPGVVADMLGIGTMAWHQGDAVEAAWRYRDALGLAQQIGDRLGLAVAAERLAAVTVARVTTDPAAGERAARLLGAAAALREAIGAPLPPIDRAEHERAVAAARGALGEQGFAAAFASGRELPPAGIVAEAG